MFEWWLTLLGIFGVLVILMMSGLPVAICFITVNILGGLFFGGGGAGLKMLILSVYDSVTTFTLVPLPLFILMGEVVFHSGVAPNMLNALDKLLGRLPGRLSLLAVGGGSLLATLTGTSMAGVALLGQLLVPEMEKKGYKSPMSLGPILGSGGLAVMIPPSGLGVLLGVIADISVGKLLIAIIVPGLLMAAIYAIYIIMRCNLQPYLAPAYDVTHIPLAEKAISAVLYILPLGFIIFMVIGLMFLGIATPSEAAATGALGCFILAACYRRLTWEVVKKSVIGTTRITGMMFLLVCGAKGFGQILAFSGVVNGVSGLATSLPIAPVFTLIIMQIMILILGGFMEPVSIMLVTIPLFMPIVHSLGFAPIFFAVLVLINLEMAGITPPFGLTLFVMKGVTSSSTTMADIYKASGPFIILNLIAMSLIIIFPVIALWLPSLM